MEFWRGVANGETIHETGPEEFHVGPPTFRTWMKVIIGGLMAMRTDAALLLHDLLEDARDALRSACLWVLMILFVLARLARGSRPVQSEPDPLALPRIRAPGTDAGLFAPLC